MTAGLTVRLQTSRRDVHVTRQVEDLQFRTTVPGGFASCSISLQRPLNVTPDELQYFGRLYVYDGRNGNTVWEGRVENLGRGADSGGQVWSVDAVGSMAHAQDLTQPLLYQVTDLTSWVPNGYAPWVETSTINPDVFGQGLALSVTQGVAMPADGANAGWENRQFNDAGIRVVSVSMHYGEDVTDANMNWQLGVAGASTSDTFTVGSSATAVVSTIGVDTYVPSPVSLYLSSFTPHAALANTQASFTNIMIKGSLFTAAGQELVLPADPRNSIYDAPFKASAIVADLLGRVLPRFDGANALIDTSSDYTFTGQCAWPDGATAADVLDALMTLLPSYYWAAWETNPATAQARFEWKPWPTTVRYDATAQDGFNSPGTASGVYDSVTVTWTDSLGNPRSAVSTAPNAMLTAAGLHRSTRIDLGSNIGDSTAAAQVGPAFLQQNAVPPSSGTLTVSRPVFDRLLGHMVQPWEILPGYLIRVREVAPGTTQDTDRDGSSTFRVVATNYSQGSNTASLELDAPALTLSNQIAQLLRSNA